MIGRGRAAGAVPNDEGFAFTGRREVVRREQAPGVVAKEERAGGPVADESVVEEFFLDKHVDHRQGQRGIGAGTNPQPAIGAAREIVPARIDDDELGAAAPRPADALRGGGKCRARVGAPEQDAAGVFVIG